ncbi:MAG: hypothetical protein JW967_07755 [Dehalococcoidales bacterium]|nr:hypothetical protein [Dehalococcoidales bacterium]
MSPSSKNSLRNVAIYTYIVLLLFTLSPSLIINSDKGPTPEIIDDAGNYSCYSLPNLINLEFTARSEEIPRFQVLKSQRTNIIFQHTFPSTRFSLSLILNKQITLITNQIPVLQTVSQNSIKAKYLVLDMPPPAYSVG